MNILIYFIITFLALLLYCVDTNIKDLKINSILLIIFWPITIIVIMLMILFLFVRWNT